MLHVCTQVEEQKVWTTSAALQNGVSCRHCFIIGMAAWMREWLCVLDCRLSDPEAVVLGSIRLGSLRILYGCRISQ